MKRISHLAQNIVKPMEFQGLWNRNLRESTFSIKHHFLLKSTIFAKRWVFAKSHHFPLNSHFERKLLPKLFVNDSAYRCLREGAGKVTISMIFQLLSSETHFLLQNQLLEKKWTFEQKVRTWRPLVADAYKHNHILRLLDPGIAEIRKSANILDFCPQSAFWAQNRVNRQISQNFSLFALFAFSGPPELGTAIMRRRNFPDASLRESAEPNLCREAGCASPTPMICWKGRSTNATVSDQPCPAKSVCQILRREHSQDAFADT